jgi:hypothetical protein
LYFYGKARPIHISVSPEDNGLIIGLEISPAGRQIPKNIRQEESFLKNKALIGFRGDSNKSQTIFVHSNNNGVPNIIGHGGCIQNRVILAIR